jgi:hypothetical protein
MVEQLAAIETLPEQFGGIAAGFRHATIGLARESAKWIRLSILPTNTFFRAAPSKPACTLPVRITSFSSGSSASRNRRDHGCDGESQV